MTVGNAQRCTGQHLEQRDVAADADHAVHHHRDRRVAVHGRRARHHHARGRRVDDGIGHVPADHRRRQERDADDRQRRGIGDGRA